jgi:hypothetical protein
MVHRENSMGVSALNILKGESGDTDRKEDEQASESPVETYPYAEHRIATEQNTLRNFYRLRNRAEMLKAHIEEGLATDAAQHPDRMSLNQGQQALLRSYSSRKLSWQPSYNSRTSSSRSPTTSTERSPVHRQQTINVAKDGNHDHERRDPTKRGGMTSTGCRCTIQ